MKELNQWFKKARDRGDLIQRLDSVFLNGRFWPYAFFRLRYFFVLAFTDTAIHLVEFIIFASIFAEQGLTAVAVFATVAHFGSVIIWGALEDFRDKIRDEVKSSNSYRVPEIITPWLQGASFGGISLAVLSTVLLAIYSSFYPLSPISLMAYGFALRFSAQVFVRTFHSGVYAVRRIYRPMAALMAVNLSSFLLTLCFWPLLQAWSYPCAHIIGSLIHVFVSFHYIKRTYRLLGWWPIDVRPVYQAFIELVRQLARPTSRVSGLAAACLSVDSLILFSFVGDQASSGDLPPLFFLFYLISPALRVAHDWAFLFYFDLIRLGLDEFEKFRQGFIQSIEKLSIIMGFASWLLACVIAFGYYDTSVYDLIVPLLPLFLARASFAFAQVQAFSERFFWNVIYGGVFFIAATIAVSMSFEDSQIRVLLVSVSFLAATLITSSSLKITQKRKKRPRVANASQWVESLTSEASPVKMARIELSMSKRSDFAPRFARDLAYEVGRGGAVMLWGERTVLCWVKHSKSWLLNTEEMSKRGVGLILDYRDIEVQASGYDALLAASSSGVLKGFVRKSSVETPRALSKDEIAKIFKKMVRRGKIIYPGKNNELPTSQQTAGVGLMRPALSFARTLNCDMEMSRQWAISSLMVAGKLEAIFLAPAHSGSGSSVAKRWETKIRALNIELVIANSLSKQNRSG